MWTTGKRRTNRCCPANVLEGGDAGTALEFTQVPNFLLKSEKLSAGDKKAFALLLNHAWQND